MYLQIFNIQLTKEFPLRQLKLGILATFQYPVEKRFLCDFPLRQLSLGVPTNFQYPVNNCFLRISFEFSLCFFLATIIFCQFHLRQLTLFKTEQKLFHKLEAMIFFSHFSINDLFNQVFSVNDLLIDYFFNQLFFNQ